MKDSLRERLDQMVDRYEEVTALLSDPDVISDNNKFRELSMEHSELIEITTLWQRYLQAETDKKDAEEMLNDAADPDMKAMMQEEIETAAADIETMEEELNVMMLPKDPNDKVPAFLEIRAGTGGDEAAIFSGDLFRMYERYASSQGWTVEILSANEGEHGGYKEIITRVSGNDVYGRLKFESGAHRVQRVPETESQGRVHTSACTVAVMPEVKIDDTVELNPADIRMDTFRSSGAGGQHVNTTDSAIRITHLPTGLVVECQEERSQHKNRAKAMAWLATRLKQQMEDAAHKDQSDTRRSLVGSGDRSERIRTYNFPQGRVTDHRVNLTLYNLDEVMSGELDSVLSVLAQEQQTELLAGLSDS